LLLACVCAITDRKNMGVRKQFIPLYISFTMLAIGISFGYNCGYAVNPARDLAPRLFTTVAGWGPGVFTEYSLWWIVPVLATHAGGIAGAGVYYIAVQGHWGREGGDDMADTVDTVDTVDDTIDINKDTVDDVEYTIHPKEYKMETESLINKERRIQTMVAYSICLMKQKTCHRFLLHLSLVLCPPALPPHPPQGWRESQR